MSGLHGELERYLAIRRALGYKLARAELLLRDYLRYLDTIGTDTVPTENAFGWATLPPNGASSCHLRDLGRSVGGDGAAHRRGASARPRRCRPCRRCADDPSVEVRQVAP